MKEKINRLMMRLRRLLARYWKWYRQHRLYVIIDGTDNSVTLSKALFEWMDVMSQQEAKVYVFRLTPVIGDTSAYGGKLYAFCMNPPIGQETQLADIQYNQKHRCIGFECLCPSVARICYDYGLPASSRIKLTVEPHTMLVEDVNGSGSKSLEFFTIMPPRR